MHPHAVHLDRFWSKVDVAGPDDCWLWTASRRPNGYGQVWWDGEAARKAHRVAFFLAYGRWPENALHRCDNRLCCNPAHLYEGTIEQNNADMRARGRHWAQQYPWMLRRGEAHHAARLTEEDVRKIRRYAAEGWPQRAIAYTFNIGQKACWDIIHRRTWRHVE